MTLGELFGPAGGDQPAALRTAAGTKLDEIVTASQQVRITGVDIQEPNLEAVFLHLTGRALRN